MNTENLTCELYSKMLRHGAAALAKERKSVNDLNVFPIPDGDTGDNMYMTIRSGCDSLAAGADLASAAASSSGGMLLGARGNSGVILSRMFAGLSKGLQGLTEAGTAEWKVALQCAVEEAYGAVANPVEGTMLTVLKDAVNAVLKSPCPDLESCFEVLCAEAEASLERTPEMLDVLRNAGVVDSGGAGLLYILQGMRDALGAEDDAALEDAERPAAAKVDISMFTQDSVLEFGYCTEFLLRLQSSKVDLAVFDESVIREYLEGVGDSLVFFRDGSIIKVHVHTRRPGDILNACQQWGEYLTIKIENMTLQHHENHMENKVRKGPRRKSAVVSVVSGEGLSATFRDMGALVIEGGQTMNPSAESFLKAFDEANAERIYVLPNNSNIIMTAQQAAGLYKNSQIIVLPTITIGGGYSVLGSIDFAAAQPDEVCAQAERIIAEVVTGMVSTANRDTQKSHKGNFIGFSKHDIFSDCADRLEAALELCSGLQAGSYDVLLIFKGADAPSSEAESLCARLQQTYPATEVILSDGGQPIFDYIFVLQ